MKPTGLMGAMQPMGMKPKTMKIIRAAPPMKAPKVPAKANGAAPALKRPSGQFQGARESAGKINGGGMGSPVAPSSHAQWEKLGHK